MGRDGHRLLGKKGEVLRAAILTPDGSPWETKFKGYTCEIGVVPGHHPNLAKCLEEEFGDHLYEHFQTAIPKQILEYCPTWNIFPPDSGHVQGITFMYINKIQFQLQSFSLFADGEQLNCRNHAAHAPSLVFSFEEMIQDLGCFFTEKRLLIFLRPLRDGGH